MHSTLRTELRGTQRVFELLRSRPTKRNTIRPRPFSQQTLLRQSANTGSPEEAKDSGESDQPVESSNSEGSTTASPPPWKAPELEKQVEGWLNLGHGLGKTARIWESISERDENGKWRLLPQAKKDLENISRWASQNEDRRRKPFGIKIQDGSIQPLTLDEVKQERISAKQEDEESRAKSGVSFLVGKGDSQKQDAVRLGQEFFASNESISKAGTIGSDHHAAVSDAGNDMSAQVPEVEKGTAVAIEEAQWDNGSVRAIKYYGSPSARRQRALKAKEKPSAVLLPAWFDEGNVLLCEELDFPSLISGTGDNQVWSQLSQEDTPAATEALTQQILEATTQKGASGSVEQNHSHDKLQTSASGGAGDTPEDHTGQPENADSQNQSNVRFLKGDDDQTYPVAINQWHELAATAIGKLRLTNHEQLSKDSVNIRAHLMLHYAQKGGEIFLDRLIENVAKMMQCDLVSFDAQDISSLLLKNGVDSSMIEEVNMLSYDVYSNIYTDSIDDHSRNVGVEDFDNMDEEPGQMPQGLPFMVGKPITIDLKALFNSKSSRRMRSRPLTKALSSEIGESGLTSGPMQVFVAVAEAMIQQAKTKRRRLGVSASSPPSGNRETPHPGMSEKDDHLDRPKDAMIIQIKELKAIQETAIGKQFLGALYWQVDRHRSNGEHIMLVGTEASHDNMPPYSADNLGSIQGAPADELSTTMLITPPVGYDKSAQYAEDREKHVARLNLRNVWTTLQSRGISFRGLSDGFWTKPLPKDLQETASKSLNKITKLWSFFEVQRLSTIIAGVTRKTKSPLWAACKIVTESDKSKLAWVEKEVDPVKETEEKDDVQKRKDKLAKIREKATKHEKKLLSGVIESEKISTTFQDIHIPTETVDALQTLTTLSLVRPEAFKYGVLASDRIPGLLLYGPPGTGKTLAAKAVARESGATMLEVSAADINDMYVGEGEKNVKALFSLAKKLSPCVVFLDEADAMFSARSTHRQRASHRELLNQFLREWDGMSNDSGSAFIMVATNRPMDLDDAVLRRLPRRLLVDLPTETDRLEILKIHLRHELLDEDVNFEDLAKRTPFYSGSDLKNLAVSAALNAVREENDLAKKHVGDQPYQYKERRILTMNHFEKALEEISASISEDMSSLREIKKFDEQYGDRKGRKRKAPKWGFNTAAEADKVLDTVKVRS